MPPKNTPPALDDRPRPLPPMLPEDPAALREIIHRAGRALEKLDPQEPPPPLPTKKLYFVGGGTHTTGRCSPPISFLPSAEDPRPHAFVTEPFGAELIQDDRGFDSHPGGIVTPQPPRYQWAS